MKETHSLNPDDFLVPGKSFENEIKVKGSRFIATIIPVSSKEDAETKYSEICKKYFDATHNCFAWRVDDQLWRYSDDGEPSGTAGKPILSAIDGKQLKQVLCIVTRYFGGTKLGTGGLIRAYGDAAAQALEQVPLKIKTYLEKVTVEYDYSLENIIRRVLQEFEGKILESYYNESVKMILALPVSKKEAFKNYLNELTNTGCTFI
ncbi:MAG: YigZ family protein [Calditrichaeota bacterium]|nr:YigZ family protein [Calditrichota bacterium]